MNVTLLGKCIPKSLRCPSFLVHYVYIYIYIVLQYDLCIRIKLIGLIFWKYVICATSLYELVYVSFDLCQTIFVLL